MQKLLLSLSRIGQDKLALLISLGLGLMWSYIGIFVTKSHYGYGGADTISHFVISRYAFTYPCLFFDLWGKPVYTALTCVFAQAGIKGILVFNSFVSAAAAYLAYKLASHLRLSYPLIALVFTFTAPVFFYAAPTTLTEPLFAFILIWASFLFFRQKYIVAAILISLLLFVRSEAYIMIPLFLLALLLKKQWIAIPFLASGFLLISVAGLCCNADPFWVINTFPYGGVTPYYGKGDLFYFFERTVDIWGYSLALAAAIGCVSMVKKACKREKGFVDKLTLALLVFGSGLAYVLAHALVWWQGTGASVGLIRVMAATVPMIAVMGNFGIDLLITTARSIKPHKIITWSIITAFIIAPLVTLSFKKNNPYKLGSEEKTVSEACAWLKEKTGKNERIFWYNTLVPYLLNRNPFDINTSMSAFYGHSLDQLKPGDIVVWDAHFGSNECRTPKEQLMQDSSFQLLAVFKPESHMLTLGGFIFEVLIFQKLAPDECSRNEEAAFCWPEIQLSEYNHHLLFEIPASSNTGSSGQDSPIICLNSATEYACEFVHDYPFNTPFHQEKNASLMLIADYTIEDYHPEMEFLLSISFHHKRKNYTHFFHKMDLPVSTEKQALRSWMKIKLPKAKTSSEKVKCFIHNTGKHGKINLLKFRVFLLNE